MATEADRKSIGHMHRMSSGSGLNYRDASNSPWKEQPTAVPIPGKIPYPQSRGANPFNRIIGSNNLYKTGNSTSSQTLLGSKKKAGMDKQSTIEMSKYSEAKEKKQRRVGVPYTHAMEVPDSEEDTGEPILRPLERSKVRSSSEDPIDMIGRKTPSSLPSTSSGRLSVGLVASGPTTRALARDGQATLRLKQRNVQKAAVIDLSVDEGDDDSIQSASGFDEELVPAAKRSSPGVTPGTVAARVSLFEHKTNSQKSPPLRRPPSALNQGPLSTDHVPRVNLVAKHGVKASMKPRIESHPVASTSSMLSSRPDPLSAPSGLVRGPKRSPKGKKALMSSDIVLPLSQWAMGCEIFGDDIGIDDAQFWLQYDSGKKALTIHEKFMNRESARVFPLDYILQGFKYTDLKRGSLDKVIICVDTRIRRGSPRRSGSSHFTPGSNGINGKLTFKFTLRHANLQNSDLYDRLVTEWKEIASKVGGRGECIDGHAAESIWELNLKAAADEHARFLEPSLATYIAAPGYEVGVEARPVLESEEPTPAIANTVAGPSTRTRAKRAAEESITRTPSLDPDELLLVYPPSGTGAVNLTRGDIQRLEPGQYLNDNVIEFGLKLWLNDFREKEPELADQVHIFNSFFYKKIHVKSKEEGYKSVRKWTTKFDLFKKKYIIVPINEHMHWYLAIICSPEFVLKPPPPELPKVISHVQTRKRKREEESAEDDDTAHFSTIAPSPPGGQPTSSGSLRQRSTSEGAVEAMLGTCTISQDRTDGTPPIAANGSDDTIPDLQYPFSESMDIDVDIDDSSTNLGAKAMDVDQSDTSAEAVRRRPSSPVSTSPSETIDVDMSPQEGHMISVDDGETKSTAIPVTRFYSSSSKGKERAMPEPTVNIEARLPSDFDLDQMALEQDEAVGTFSESTYIFTLDSLGTKHPSAITTLREYLKMEAKDKKGLDPAMTSNAVGKAALVPGQPNFCDCGVYLIHFVQAFMKDPVRLSEVILTKKPRDYGSGERGKDWDAGAVEDLRERLYNRIMELSAKWKEQRSSKGKEKETQQRKDSAETTATGPSTATASVVEDSDGDIEIGEVVSKVPAKKPPNNTRTKTARSTIKAGETKASRLR